MLTTREEVCFIKEWAKTVGGEDFFLGSRDNIHMFSTEQYLKILSKTAIVYCDGTFAISPRLFYQVFTIHGFKYGKLFPLVYCILPAKSREVYNTVFLLTKEIAQNFNLVIDPVALKADFELALVQSVRISFPNTTFRGCYYQFAQAIWKKLKIVAWLTCMRLMDQMIKNFFVGL